MWSFAPNSNLFTHVKRWEIVQEGFVSWESGGRYQYEKMFCWEPEGRCHHRVCTAIIPFSFSREHLWILIAPFWLFTHECKKIRNHTGRFCQLRARRALSLWKDVPLRTTCNWRFCLRFAVWQNLQFQNFEKIYYDCKLWRLALYNSDPHHLIFKIQT